MNGSAWLATRPSTFRSGEFIAAGLPSSCLRNSASAGPNSFATGTTLTTAGFDGDVDLERGRLEVYGKSREYEAVGLTDAAHDALSRLERVQEPPTDDWPLFPTDHAVSRYAAVEDATGERPEPGSDIDMISATRRSSRHRSRKRPADRS